ncbi:MAG: hypothetical protein HRT34_05830 [Alcanivorax sp.]|nr:hypothetical protein [Alcanivorax sp.]
MAFSTATTPMTAPRLPFRSAFPFWALLLWLAVGLSVWPAQAVTPPAASPVLVDDSDLFGLALPRDAGGQWQRRDSGDDPGWDPEPTQGPLAALALMSPGTAGPPRAVVVPTPVPRFPRYHDSAPRAPPL